MSTRSLRRRTLVIAAVTLAVIPASVANAAPVPCVGAKVKTLRDTLVNAKPDGPFFGTLLKGQTFLVLRTSPSGKYTFGYAYGGIKARGWVDTVDLGAKSCATPRFTG